MKGMLKPCATSSPSKQPSGQLARRSRARRRVGLIRGRGTAGQIIEPLPLCYRGQDYPDPLPAPSRAPPLTDWITDGSAKFGLADLATSPGQAAAAASATAAAAAAATAASAAASATATAAASAPLRNLFPDVGRADVFLIKDVKRPQADVGDFFLIESDLGSACVPGRCIRSRHSGCRGCTTRQRQRYSGDSHDRDGLPTSLPLRSTFCVRHGVLRRLGFDEETVPRP
jgi:hypothetical protein